jgi:hypothetical protein
MKPKPLTLELRGFDQLTPDWQRCLYWGVDETFYLFRGEVKEIAHNFKEEAQIVRRIRLEFAENKRQCKKCREFEDSLLLLENRADGQ